MGSGTSRATESLLLVCLCAALADGARGGEAPPAGGPELPRELTFNAARIVVQGAHPDGAVVLQGNVHVVYGTASIEAEEAVLFVKSREIVARGSVRLADGANEVHASEVVYDLENERGIARDAKLVVKGPKRKGRRGRIEKGEADLVIVRAPVIRRLGKERFEAEDVTITTCDFAEPHWHWSAKKVEVTPGNRLRSRSNRLYLGSVPVFYLPLISVDLDELARYPSLSVSYGHSSQWGHHILTKFGLDFDGRRAVEAGSLFGMDDLNIDVDWREKRGMAYGLGAGYYTTLGGRGNVETYVGRETDISFEDDLKRATRDLRRNSADPSNGVPVRTYAESALYAARRAAEGGPVPTYVLEPHRGDVRWGVDLVHRNLLAPGWRLDAEVHAYSDRDFRHEYFESAFYNDLDPGTFAALTRTGESSMAWLKASTRVKDFETRTEEMPDFEWRLPGTPVGAGAVISADFGAASLRRRYDEALNIEPHDATRVRGRVEVSRPFGLGAFTLRPFVGTDQAYYDEDAAGEDDVVRGAALYGGELSFKLFGLLREPGEDGTGGLRHIIEPRIRYTGVSDPTHDPVKILDFDGHDDLVGTDVVTFRLDQRLQTKRLAKDGEARSVDVASLELSADYFPRGDERREYNSGREWDYLKARIVGRPAEGVELYGAADFDLHGEEGVSFDAGLRLKRSDAFGLRLDYRLLREDPDRGVLGSEEVSAVIEARLGPKWRLRGGATVEFERNSLVEHGAHSWSVTLVRDFHDWEIAVSYSVDEDDDDRITFVRFTPKGYSRNLVRGSAEVIPVPPDYSPAGEGADIPADW